MLNIPEAVKALFKRDTVRKNVRLVWENGRPDIINNQLVSESLRFRESICSSDAIAFGTAEASTLEFETVGVENLFGQWLRAYIEVDASSLPADLQETRADLSFPVYSIPLGRFVVTACPRNHEALAHRKFSCSSKLGALSTILPSGLISAALRGIDCPATASWALTVSDDRFRVYSGIIPQSSCIVAGTKTTTFASASTGFAAILSSLRVNNGTPTLTVVTNRLIASDDIVLAIASERIESYDAADTAARLATQVYSAGTVTDASGTRLTLVQTRERIAAALAGLDARIRLGLHTLTAIRVGSSTVNYYNTAPGVELLMPPAAVSVSASGAGSTSNVGNVMGIKITGGSTAYGQVNLLSSDSNTITTYKLPDSLKTGLTADTDAVETSATQPHAELKDALNQTAEIMLSMTEARGAFYSKGRDGLPVMRTLSSAPVATIRPAEYSSCWLEEQDVEPIGSIRYTLGDQEYSMAIGSGASIYTLSSMAFFERAGLTADDVAAVLQADLVPALAELAYTPVDLEALGLPYMEAGDRIEIELEDGSTVQTYVLERNLEGIQHLNDNVLADGVTVQELEAAELEDET